MRSLLVGECNPYGTDPEFALYPEPPNSAGGRLCRYVLGLTVQQYLRRFDRANLCPREWDGATAREVARIIGEHSPVGRWHLLCGARVAKCFGLPSATVEQPIRTHYRDPDGGGGYLVIPHPSGRCRIWNGDVVGAIRARLRELEVLPA